MSKCLFTDEVRTQVLASTALGVSLDDSARAAGVSPRTLRSWVERGRREAGGSYADFAVAIEQARQAAASRPTPLTRDELKLAVSEMVRAGSVPAAKLYWEMLRGEKAGASGDGANGSVIDLLARKRREGK